jgi:hypothetical protein
MITMAQESSAFSNELDVFTAGSPVNFGLDNDFNLSNNAFNYPSGFNVGTDDSVTGSSLGDSSIPRSRQAEEISRRSNDHNPPQSHYEPLNDGEFSTAMEEMAYNLGNSHDAPNDFDTISNSRCDDFILENGWYLSEQHHTYTFNQALPASSHCDNSSTEPQDVTCGLEDSMMNEFFNHVSCNADDHFVPMSQNLVYSREGEGVVQRQLLIEDQNVPLLMATYSHIASGSMHATGFSNMPLQRMNTQDSRALDACLGLLEAPSVSFRPNTLGPISNVGLYTNCPSATPPVQDSVWSHHPVGTSCYGNIPSRTVQLMPTPHATSAIAEISENRSCSTTVTAKSMRQKNRSILPAPAKSYTGTTHSSNSLAPLQKVYGPQKPRGSVRKKLTKPGRVNANKVRQIGSCVVCKLGKKKVIKF